MEYQPEKWKKYSYLLGSVYMVLGALGYIASIYIIFLIDSSWVSWSLGATMLALSVLLIIIGYNNLQEQRDKQLDILDSDRLAKKKDAAVRSSGALVPRNESDTDRFIANPRT